MQTLYRYRPASPRALALLVCADAKDRKTAGYIADLLWARTTTKDHRIPMLHELLAPHRTGAQTDTRSSAEKAFDAVELMFKQFGGNDEK